MWFKILKIDPKPDINVNVWIFLIDVLSTKENVLQHVTNNTLTLPGLGGLQRALCINYINSKKTYIKQNGKVMRHGECYRENLFFIAVNYFQKCTAQSSARYIFLLDHLPRAEDEALVMGCYHTGTRAQHSPFNELLPCFKGACCKNGHLLMDGCTAQLLQNCFEQQYHVCCCCVESCMCFSFRWLPALLCIFHNFPGFPCGQMLLFNLYTGFPNDALLLLFSMWLLLLIRCFVHLGIVGFFTKASLRGSYFTIRSSTATSVQGKYIFFSVLVLFILLCHLRETVTNIIERYLVLHADLQNNSSWKEISFVVVYFKFAMYDHVCLFWETCSSFCHSSCTISCTCEAIKWELVVGTKCACFWLTEGMRETYLYSHQQIN